MLKDWKNPFKARTISMKSDLGFQPSEEYEIAKQRIANMLDDSGWQWLRSQINDQRLTWPEIMDLVDAHI